MKRDIHMATGKVVGDMALSARVVLPLRQQNFLLQLVESDDMVNFKSVTVNKQNTNTQAHPHTHTHTHKNRSFKPNWPQVVTLSRQQST